MTKKTTISRSDKEVKGYLKDIGLTYADVAKMGNLRIKIPIPAIQKVLRLDLAELRELYLGLGIGGDLALTLEGMYCAMLWLYLAGRIKFFGFEKDGKVHYKARKNGKDWVGIASAVMTEKEQSGLKKRLMSFCGARERDNWLYSYLVNILSNGTKMEKMLAIKSILFNNLNYVEREDYKHVAPFVKGMDMVDRRGTGARLPNRMIYSLMDVLRIAAHFCFRGCSGKELFYTVITGDVNFKDTVINNTDPILASNLALPIIKDVENEFAKAFIEDLALL